VRVIDFAAVRKDLRKLGFKKVLSSREIDMYYDHSLKSFSKTHEVLRIRKSRRSIVTYKGPLLSHNVKSRVEHNCNIDSPEAMNRILQSLGFRQWKILGKTREKWKQANISVNLDEVDKLGKFVEVEMICLGNENMRKVETRLFSTLKKLKLNTRHATTKSYIDLIDESPLKQDFISQHPRKTCPEKP
jgi:predicted adenylyl cyclase CyaB